MSFNPYIEYAVSRKCSNCRAFYKPNNECHKRPPVYVENNYGKFPQVKLGEQAWCDEFVPKPELVAFGGGFDK